MVEIILHVGYPKAASTFLQKEIFSHHKDLMDYSAQNIKKPNFNEVWNVINHVSKTDSLNFDINWCVSQISEFKKKIKYLSGKKPIISNEGLVMSGRADRKLIVSRLKKLFGDAKVIIVIRKQKDLLNSTFYQHMRKSKLYGCFESINAWLDDPLRYAKHITSEYNHPIRRIQFYQVLRTYENIFGKENVLILLYEELKEDKISFITKLSKFCGINVKESIRLLKDAKKVNKNSSRKELFVYNILKKLPFLKPLTRKFPEKLKTKFIEILPVRKIDTQFIKKWDEKITQIAKKDNRKIKERYDLPLEKYGYTL